MATRVLKTTFTASHEDIDRLFECNRTSATVWNTTLQLSKNFAIANDGKWISKGELYASLKNQFPLHSQSVQMVADKYLDARDSAHSAILKGFPNKYPWREKKNFNTQWKDQAFRLDFEKRELTLSLGVWEGRRQKGIVAVLPKKTIAKLRKIFTNNKDAVSQIELCYDNGLVLAITYTVAEKPSLERQPMTTPTTRKALVGVDLGEIHSITACSSTGESVIVTGRKLRSVHRLRNKLMSRLTKAQSKCTKGSRRWKKLQRKKRFILSKSKHQVESKTHEITKNFVDWCVKNGVRKVFCGDPEGVQRGTSGRKKKNRSTAKGRKKIRKRKVSQKLSNWNFGVVKKYLRYKLQARGIEFEVIGEAYTSQTCPNCGQRHKPSNRNYRCFCGYEAHRDVVGAHNILALGKLGRFEKICDFETRRPKYLRLTA